MNKLHFFTTIFVLGLICGIKVALHSRLGVSRRISPKKFSTRVTYVIKLSKAYKTSSNVLKEIVKLTKEKYK